MEQAQGSMTGIINYGLGNLFSLEKALKRNHTSYLVSASPSELENCSRFILSGVGHFEFGMQQLQQKGLVDFLRRQVAEGKFLLGICLGMQLLCNHSEEGNADGLGFVDTAVARLKVAGTAKIPHIGWNTVYGRENNPLFNGIDPAAKFYFTHSYGVHDAGLYSAGKTNYGGSVFISAIHQERVYGVQFHPEKSFDQGLQLLKNFASL